MRDIPALGGRGCALTWMHPKDSLNWRFHDETQTVARRPRGLVDWSRAGAGRRRGQRVPRRGAAGAALRSGACAARGLRLATGRLGVARRSPLLEEGLLGEGAPGLLLAPEPLGTA